METKNEKRFLKLTDMLNNLFAYFPKNRDRLWHLLLKKICAILFLFSPIFLFGQIPSDTINRNFVGQIEEQMVCFTDRNLYLSGEEIWFSVIVLMYNNADEGGLSEVLFVELFDRSTKVIARAKYPLEGNRCSGSLQIPPEALSQAAFLRFYTQYQRNQPAGEFALLPITIVNTELTLPMPDKNFSIYKNSDPGSPPIRIVADKKSYSPRSKINLEINFPSGFEAYYCLSAALNKTIKANLDHSSKSNKSQRDSIFYLPDIRGVSLSGFVRKRQNLVSLSDVPVYLSAFGNNNLLHITQTQANGSFVFGLNKMENMANIFVSIDPGMNPDVEVLINNDFSNQFSPLPDQFFNIDTSYRDLLSDMLVNFESQKNFGSSHQPPDHEILAVSNLPSTYDFSIRLDDFIDLGTLQEVFYEIVAPVSVKTDQGEKYLSVANYQTQQVARAGLVILDDAPIFDVEELLKISPANIASIDVINRPYYLGDYLVSSVVSLKTKTGDFGGYKFPPQSIFLEYQTLSKTRQFMAPDFGSEKARQSPLPDFRTTLFWSPLAEVNGVNTSLSFSASDATGKYDIVIWAVSKEGKIIQGITSMTVER